MILAIASGKGGTGKTTVAANLAKMLGAGAVLLDCDVEAPNAHLFFRGNVRERKDVNVPSPIVDVSLCDHCGECARSCQYRAIASLPAGPLFFPELCHGCGGCALICPRKAIRETERRIGEIEILEREDGATLVQGKLDIGVAMSPPLIRAVKNYAKKDAMTIIDAPPGTSCPVVAAVRGVDFVVLVTEPTPFGLHDLKLAVETVRELKLRFGVVINRVGVGDDRVHVYLKQNAIPLLLEIPDDRRVAEAYAKGRLAIDALPEYRERFARLLDQIDLTMKG